MLDFLNDWGGLIGLIGAILSLIGLTAALLAAQRAEKARDAAEKARNETRIALARALTTVDLERAIALSQRLKELQRDRKWETSLALYPILKAMLININSRHPAPTPALRERLHLATLQVNEMENDVAEAVTEGSEPSEPRSFSRKLNDIQINLGSISGSIHFSESGTSS